MISFNELSPSEKAEITYADLQKRKVLKKQAGKEADSYLIGNLYRVQKRVNHSKNRGVRSI